MVCLATLRDKICRCSKIFQMDVMGMKSEYAVIEFDSLVLPLMKVTSFQNCIDDVVVSGKKELAG